MFHTIFFDLDGTLINSKIDLANAIQICLSKFQLKYIDNETIYSFVGNGTKKLVEDTLLLNNRLDLVDRFLNCFLDYYSHHVADNTFLYEGMIDVLNKLKNMGILMFVISNKSEKLSIKVLQSMNIGYFFQKIVGGDTFNKKKPSPYPILKIKDEYKLDLNDCLFIGDSENDIIAAKSSGVKIAWTSYGFRKSDILRDFRVDYIVNNPTDILSIM